LAVLKGRGRGKGGRGGDETKILSETYGNEDILSGKP
jgi:hypothetical protein